MARDFRRILIASAVEIVEGIKPNHAARGHAGRSPGALRSRGFTDPGNRQRGETGPGRFARYAGESAVHHRGNALHRDGTFRDVRRKNDFALRGGRDGAILLGRR